MKLSNEAKIGIMVVAVLVGLAVITVKTSDFHIRKRGYQVKVHFLNIDGVEENAPVRLNGLEIGAVQEMKILYDMGDKMELTLWINEGVKIHEGAQAHVKNLGLFGEKYIGLTMGDAGKPYLSAGAVIQGVEPANFDKIMADGEVIAENLKEISQEINERLKMNSESIDEIMANLRVTSQHVRNISQNVDERLDTNKEHIDNIIANLDSATENFDEMSYDLKLNPWKLMYKERKKRDKKMRKKKVSKDK